MSSAKLPTVILGGGISGLSAAFYSATKNPQNKVILIESSKRLGGWIQSKRHENGIIFESGPRTIRPAGIVGINTLNLTEEIGLSHQIKPIISGDPVTVNRQIYVNNTLHKLPTKLFKKQTPFSKPLIYSILNEFFASSNKLTKGDESIYSFVKRRFGDELANYAIDPMVRGICAGDSREISAEAFVAGPLFELDKKYGGVVRGYIRNGFKLSPKERGESIKPGELASRAMNEKWNVWSLENGLETLVEKLTSELKKMGVEILTEFSTDELKVNDDKETIEIIDDKGYKILCESLLCSIPSHEVVKLLKGKDFHPLSEKLKQIPFVDVAVVNVEFPKMIPGLEPAFGFLVPSSEPKPILGVIYDSFSFPNSNNHSIFTVMMGGKWFKDVFGENVSSDYIEKMAVNELKNILGISLSPDRVQVRILKKCIAQYIIGHKRVVQEARDLIRNRKLKLHLIGSSYDGVGVNDAIMSARKAVFDS